MAQRGRQKTNPDLSATYSTTASTLLFAPVDDDDNDTMSSLSLHDDSRPTALQLSSNIDSTHSPYIHPTHQATASTSTFNVGGQPTATANTPTAGSTPTSTSTQTMPGTPRTASSRKPSSLRHTSTAVPAESISSSIKRRASSPSAREGKYPPKTQQRVRATPRLPHSDDPPAPATALYWSRAPIHGTLPMRAFRAHTVTLVDHVAWLFGGCDDKGCWKDVYCFDTDTMHWSHPDTLGDVPPPCRAHTATLVDRKIVIFGGGQGPVYYDSTYIFDTTTRSWFCPLFPHSQSPSQNPESNTEVQPPASQSQNPSERPLHPAPRRAHTSVLYNGKIYIFGGGNGLTALNDLWTLDVSRLDPTSQSTYSYGGGSFGGSGASGGLRWSLVETQGEPPVPRGYHTANLVGNIMIVVGGSDGRECFSDVWCLHLDTLVWTRLNLPLSHRRLSHTSTQVGSCLFIVGGHDGGAYRDEVVLFNLVNLQYEPRTVKGKPPSARGYHATILADSRLFVFGGFNGHDVFDDVHVLDLAGAAYLPQVMSFRVDV
ncbi:uncharacterized protein F5891DRAFT_1060546 [Suillus fuscotomentosus]|uniref:Galactose oxidase n=1 Tax=Suillus fuscotomentosus TaxID=1912939 RepID=A0AAD4HG44_9AGAM|nr:uncharacterized protein F5891DRAFT_1060546 [Suillus fuscotomentosus]KAG1894941.1 hypothetical protein F5891DRAFT_1060546 [Suillus fuscotomentosus]